MLLASHSNNTKSQLFTWYIWKKKLLPFFFHLNPSEQSLFSLHYKFIKSLSHPVTMESILLFLNYILQSILGYLQLQVTLIKYFTVNLYSSYLTSVFQFITFITNFFAFTPPCIPNMIHTHQIPYQSKEWTKMI